MNGEIGLWLSVLSLTIWVILLGFWGQFWRSDQRLTRQETDLSMFPTICAVIPARNEADLLPVTLRSLLNQDYPGHLTVILVDDSSTDGTANVARDVAQELNKTQQLHVLSGQALAPGWTGKLWALHQGIQYAQTLTSPPDYFLLTDADIEHDALNLRCLVAKAQQEDLDLVSLMVRLRCESFWEKLLIPAFVFFFQKLNPFPWVNDPTKSTAAAAGGCILITREALTRIGGIEVVRDALIDDCALAQAVKSRRFTQFPHREDKGDREDREDKGENTSSSPSSPSSPSFHKIWLGLTNSTQSLRPYPSLSTIWDMIARTAFTQLNYSLGLLIVTVMGMIVVYIVPPVCAIFGLLTGNSLVAIAGLSTWLVMAYAYLPTIRFYGCSPALALCLPGIALLYTLMTVDSAVRHWQKRGGTWKGRVYSKTIKAG
ncbi:glycosyltransferase [Scytonema sp. HK-05]|uniref:glycosyltransferase n=1 Tax=Scytonema sp. HK-05 TaxID=1137095 RepID=UPI0009359B1A|nr:glycosyltransferase [Scytonema sp. HK-05]OKH55419.1 glycosyl transferase family 2 [Scytonema sp. HK-05]